MTIDATALYTNITRSDGVEAVKDALENRDNPEVPNQFLVKLLDLVHKWNIFEFDEQLFQQLIGWPMGTRVAPNLADIFMARLDKLILECAAKFGEGVYPIMFLKRFLDDYFMIFTGSAEKLHQFLDVINKLHPGIKFTMSHTKLPSDTSCNCEQTDTIPFLDTSVRIIDGCINTDLYRKPSDKNKYLLPSSCHPPHTT